MGCVSGKVKKDEEYQPAVKTYSWDSRRSANIDLQNYIIENLHGRETIRIPPSVNGEQMLIQNCSNAIIYIIDHMNSVNIDDCRNCTIVLGAVKSSVFLRNCTDVICITVCGQFRTRDSRKCNIYLHSETQPIIETSTRIKFGTYMLTYNCLTDQLNTASLNINTNSWTRVHDFTPVEGESNWSFMGNGESENLKLRTYSEEIYQKLSDFGVKWAQKPISLIILESTV